MTRWWRPPLWYRVATASLALAIPPSALAALYTDLTGGPTEHSPISAVLAVLIWPTIALEANRSRIGVGYPGITFRSVTATLTVPWADVRDIWAHRSGIWIVLADGSTMRAWPLGTSRVVAGLGLGRGNTADEVVEAVRAHVFGDGRPASASPFD